MNPRERFHNLDAMRGICGLSIVMFHCDGLFGAGEVFCHGFLAVDMFFILSGFVIAHTYGPRLAAGLDTGAFLKARVARLSPVYWAGTMLCTAMLVAIAAYRPAGSFFSAGQIAGLSAMAMALIPQLTLGGLAYPANPVAWSLMGEFIANALYARLLHARSTSVLIGIVLAGWSGCAVIGYLNGAGWCFGATAATVALTPLRAIPAFVMGVVLYRGYRVGALDVLPRVTPLAPLLVWLVIAQVPTFAATPSFDLAVVTLASPLLLALLVRAPESAPRPLLWLGAISYPLYASHLALVNTARYTPLFGLNHGPDPVRAAFVITLALGVAALLHRFVEQAPRKLRRLGVTH
ncbi:MAG TPA: acyltransferase [Rhizomicrobium sp.]|nr:acyltransferase [Rhizomicrobium sp.]